MIDHAFRHSFNQETVGVMEFPVDTLVALKGLEKASHLNGRRGVVVAALAANGRIGVQLFPKHEKHIVHAKPSSLMKEYHELYDQGTIRHLEPCACCGLRFQWKTMQVCSICKAVPYCSRKCQNAHWKSQACQAFRELRKNPNSNNIQMTFEERTKAVIGISSTYRAKGELKAAEKVLQDAIKGPFPVVQAVLYNSLSVLYQFQGRIDEAVEANQMAVAGTLMCGSKVGTAHLNLAGSLRKQGDYVSVIKACNNALMAGLPSEIIKHAHTEIGSCCLKMADTCANLGDHDQAMQYFKEAVQAFRASLANHGRGDTPSKYLGRAHQRLGMCLRSQAKYMYILTTLPKKQLGLDEQARLLRCSGYALKESIGHLTKGVELDPKNKNQYKNDIAQVRALLAMPKLDGVV